MEVTTDSAISSTGAVPETTDRREREQTLVQLHRTSRRLAQTETLQEVCETVARVSQETANLSTTCLYLWNEAVGVLEPRASTPDADKLFDDLPTFSPGSSIAWDVFLDGTTRVFDDVRDHENVYNEGTPVRSELIVPLGEFGVMISGTTSQDAFTGGDILLAETLAASATAALQRVKRESDLRETERERREQNATVHRLSRVNSLIRAVQRDVVRATTRRAVEQAVCDDLVRVDHYQFAWIGDTDESGRLAPRAWAGASGSYLDELLHSPTATETPLPARQALETGEAVSTHQFRVLADEQPAFRTALDCGFQSQIAVPLASGDHRNGVLEVYGGQSTTFSDEEKAVLCELGEFVGNALNGIERQEAIVAESEAEFEFRVHDANDVVYRLARHADCTLDLDSLLPHTGGKWVVYLTVSEGDRETLLDTADRFVSVDCATPLSEDDRVEVVVSDFEIARVLGEHGATLHSLHARPDGGRIVIRLPQPSDVRTVVGSCASVLPCVDLVRRSRVTSDANARDAQQSGIDRLTDRQRDVLETAYRQGFFEWPREHTGEEIATSLGVSPPTYHRHVRTGIKRLLETIFE
ncbi:bacterio-opsin activator domain-containing protein [Haloferax sp. ATB1]|uniref:bacterio-opsin activator domain-containing protein n=1 Tax=Haloferax sp. ATB1 TaxID=1508454 RepID=UPI0005B1F3BE|nr:bacterio-opsin activator domain-containing protein [Haloferax sp. ATB1]